MLAGNRETDKPLLVDDLGELEGCLGIEEDKGGGCRRPFLSSVTQAGSLKRAAAAASSVMQRAHEKMRLLGSAHRQQPAVESSITFAQEVERHVGSAAWCGLHSDSGEQTPTQLAAALWTARNASTDGARKDAHDTCSVLSSSETVREAIRERDRELVSSLVHLVTASDSISGLCLKYDVSLEDLLTFNKPASRSSLLARKSVYIPIFARSFGDRAQPSGTDEDTEDGEDEAAGAAARGLDLSDVELAGGGGGADKGEQGVVGGDRSATPSERAPNVRDMPEAQADEPEVEGGVCVRRKEDVVGEDPGAGAARGHTSISTLRARMQQASMEQASAQHASMLALAAPSCDSRLPSF
jgi:hypothetical protein